MSQFNDGKPPLRSPKTKNEWGILVIISFFFALFLCVDLGMEFTASKLSVPFFLASWIILLILHEFGHAIMARLLGWKVELIAIGFGKPRARITVLGMPVEFRTVPLSGFAQPRAADLVLPRLKQFLIYGAGPGIELIAVAVVGYLSGWDSLLQRSADPGMIALQSFCVAALLGVFLNLIPIPHETEEGTAWSDGLGLVLCWKLPLSFFQQQIQKTTESP